MPNQFDFIKDMFWCGDLNDSEFIELATNAGATAEQISSFLAEVREHDGVL